MKQFWVSRKTVLAAIAVCTVCTLAAFAAGGERSTYSRDADVERVLPLEPVRANVEPSPAPNLAESTSAETAAEPAVETEEHEAASAEQPQETVSTSSGSGTTEKAAVSGNAMDNAVKETEAQSQPQELAEGEPPVAETIEEAKARVAAESEGPSSGYSIVISPEVIEEHLEEKHLVDGQYPTTADGKTYGPISLESVVGTAPDLVSVIATNGKSGYAKFEEFDPYAALLSNPNTTPEELAYAKAHLDDYADILIPVYDLSGNVIGQFVSGSTQSNIE